MSRACKPQARGHLDYIPLCGKNNNPLLRQSFDEGAEDCRAGCLTSVDSRSSLPRSGASIIDAFDDDIFDPT